MKFRNRSEEDVLERGLFYVWTLDEARPKKSEIKSRIHQVRNVTEEMWRSRSSHRQHHIDHDIALATQGCPPPFASRSGACP